MSISESKVKNIKRDFNLFGIGYGLPKTKYIELKDVYIKDGKLNIFYSKKDYTLFVDKFNKEIDSKNANYTLDDNTKIYLVLNNNLNYIVLYNRLKVNNKKDLNMYFSIKKAYNLNGTFLSKVKDTYLNKKGSLHLFRKYKQKTSHFYNNKLFYI